MSEEEILQKHHDESESEDSEDEVEDIPQVDIDPSTLTPLSPEVISKQVHCHGRNTTWNSLSLSCAYRLLSTLVPATFHWDLGHWTDRGPPRFYRYNRSRSSR